MALFIESLEVYQVSPEARIVSWKYLPTNDDLSQVKVAVLRSYSPSDAFEQVALVSNPQTYYRDAEVNLKDHWRGAYYKLSIKHGDQTIEAGPESLRGGISNPAREIMRQLNIDLSFSGSPTLIYLRRKGKRCTACWDPVLKKATQAACLSCFATGYEGGYYQPLLTLVNFQPEVRTDQSGVTRTQPAQTSIKMAGYPEIRPGDLLFETNQGMRWRIVSINPSEMERILLVQEATIALLTPSDVEHKLPIPDGLSYVITPHWTRAKRYSEVLVHDRDKDPIERIPIWR